MLEQRITCTRFQIRTPFDGHRSKNFILPPLLERLPLFNKGVPISGARTNRSPFSTRRSSPGISNLLRILPPNIPSRNSNTRLSTASIERSLFIFLSGKEAHLQALEISLPCHVIAMPPFSKALHPHRREASRLLGYDALFQPSLLLSPGVVLVILLFNARRTMVSLPVTAMRLFAALVVCILVRRRSRTSSHPNFWYVMLFDCMFRYRRTTERSGSLVDARVRRVQAVQGHRPPRYQAIPHLSLVVSVPAYSPVCDSLDFWKIADERLFG